MAFVAGVDRTTGDIVTATFWNNYNGASGSIDFLKTEADKLDDITIAASQGSVDTEFQNTSGSPQYVMTRATANDGDGYRVDSDAASPPSVEIGQFNNNSGGNMRGVCFFAVPIDAYYKAVTVGGTLGVTFQIATVY